jgi:Tol biopolymer transport system component/DNA-binding winged helix-turn-helix (wHTH) protein
MQGDFRVGEWLVQPAVCRLSGHGRTVQVRAKVADLLVYLASHAGEVVSKDQLLNDVWGTDAVSESALTRTVTELRRALGDDAERPWLLETIAKRGYRLIAPVHYAGSSNPLCAPIGPPHDDDHCVSARRARAARVALAGLALLALAIVAGLALRTRSESAGGTAPASPRITRLTFEPGLQLDPAFSPDGRYLAYAGNRAGNFDIWVRPISGGDAVQITNDPAHDWQPDWAPDGSRILFRSERGGGGIFAVPALGGLQERVTTFGYRPRWSPDGNRFLFASALLGGTTTGRVYITRLDGSTPTAIVPPAALPQPWGQLVPAIGANVTWHPDGVRLSYLTGCCATPELMLVTFDPFTGSVVRSAVHGDVAAALRRLDLQPQEIEPVAWSPAGNAFYLVGFSNTLDVWRLDVDPSTLEIRGGPHRLASGAGSRSSLAVSRDGRRLAYAQSTGGSRLWLYPLDESGTRVVGDGRPVTPREVQPFRPDMTHDGARLLFLAGFPGRGGADELRELSLADGRERILRVLHGDLWFTPRWSRDGAYIAYRYSPAARPSLRSLRVLDVGSGDTWQLTSPIEAVSDNAWSWSPDGRHVLASGGRYRPGQNAIAWVPVAAAPTAERQARVVASDRDRALWQAMLSPNGRWIAFEAVPVHDSRGATLYIVHVEGGAWVPVTDGTAFDDKPRWSADGRLLYFMSSRGGVPNVWGVPIDPDEGRPAGPPFQLTHFDGRTSIAVPHVAYTELAVGAGRLALDVAEPATSIWMQEAPER